MSLVTIERGVPKVHGGNVLLAYRQFQVRRGLLPSTMQASTYVLQRFELWLGASILVATTAQVETFLDGRYRVARTRYCVISTLHCFYRWALAEGLVSDDPTTRVVRPRLRHYLPRPIRDDDLATALAEAPPLMRAWLCLGAFMGLRCQEIATLRAEDILRDQNMVLVHMGKGHHQRLVPLNREVDRALGRMGLPVSGPLFRRPNGTTWTPSRVSQRINEHLRAVGVNATAHQLRHWFGTRVYAETRDLRLTQGLLGHSSPTTTIVYVAFSPGEAAAVVRDLGLASPP